MTTRWDAARAASRRPLPKRRKPIAPIASNFDDSAYWCKKVPHRAGVSRQDYVSCSGCNYHVCNCGKPEDELSPAQAFEAAIFPLVCGCRAVSYRAMHARFKDVWPIVLAVGGGFSDGLGRVWRKKATTAAFKHYCAQHETERIVFDRIDRLLDALPPFTPAEQQALIFVSPVVVEVVAERFAKLDRFRVQAHPYLRDNDASVRLVPRGQYSLPSSIEGEMYSLAPIGDAGLRGKALDGFAINEARFLHDKIDDLAQQAVENLLKFGQPGPFAERTLATRVEMFGAALALPAEDRKAAINLLTTGVWKPPKEGP